MGKELQNNYNSWSINPNTILPNDELQGEEENIMRMFHKMGKLEIGSGALELGSRDSSPSRTTLRLATINLKHTPYSLLLLPERRETYPTTMLLPMGDRASPCTVTKLLWFEWDFMLLSVGELYCIYN